MAVKVIVTDEFSEWHEGLTKLEQTSLHAALICWRSGASTYVFLSIVAFRGQGSPTCVNCAYNMQAILIAFSTPSTPNAKLLLVGGTKTSTGNRRYEDAIRLADRLSDEYLRGE